MAIFKFIRLHQLYLKCFIWDFYRPHALPQTVTIAETPEILIRLQARNEPVRNMTNLTREWYPCFARRQFPQQLNHCLGFFLCREGFKCKHLYSSIDKDGCLCPMPVHQLLQTTFTQQLITIYLSTYTFYGHYCRSMRVSWHPPPIRNGTILLEHSFTACMPLLKATSASGFGRRCKSSPHWCYLHHLRTNYLLLNTVPINIMSVLASDSWRKWSGEHSIEVIWWIMKGCGQWLVFSLVGIRAPLQCSDTVGLATKWGSSL